MKTIHLIAISALAAAAVLVLTLIANSHVHSEYHKRDNRYRALALKTDHNTKVMTKQHEAQITAVRVADTKVLKHSVKVQKNHDTRVLKRALRRLKSAMRRQVTEAQRNGYASGSAAGYSNGHSAGVTDGLHEGSDQVTCSDDPDVTWLPFCF